LTALPAASALTMELFQSSVATFAAA